MNKILDVAEIVGLISVLYGVWMLNPRVVPVIFGVIVLGVSLFARCRMDGQTNAGTPPRKARTRRVDPQKPR